MDANHPQLPTTKDQLAATFLDTKAPITKTENRLPHWQQGVATVFITFRLGDSVPIDKLRTWAAEKKLWLANNPKPWNSEQSAEHRSRFIIPFEQWLDRGYGSAALADPSSRQPIEGTLQHYNHTRYLIHAYVVMPTHVHCLATFLPEHRLQSIVQNWKKFSAREINRANDRTGSFWQRDFFDRIVRDFDHFESCLNYIRNNPVKARLRADQFVHYERPNPRCDAG